MKKTLGLIFLITVITTGLVHAERNYTYTYSVGAGRDFATINEAVAAIQEDELSAESLGCIYVYPGLYREQLNSFYPGGNDLPAHCDLIGMGEEPYHVIIEHKRRSE